jgi:DNA-binding LacI/PurR family transcriptional regulator
MRERRRGRARRRSSSRPGGRSATISEVAARARVSTATVSRVVAGTVRVSDGLREQVLRAVSELDYRPNRVARNLRVRATRTIGVVIPDIVNPFFTAVVRGIEDALQPEDYTLLLGNSDGRGERERLYLDTLRAEGVAGILFVPSDGRPHAYRSLGQAGIPVVAMDRSPAGLDVDLVAVSNEEGAHDAVAHLCGHGWKRVGMVAGPAHLNVARERERGYERALREAGMAVDPDLVRRADFKEHGGYDAMRSLLDVAHRPTAVFVANNLMAMGALHALGDAGVRIPQDMGIVCFDDVPWGAWLQPPLTVVAQPAFELGASAARILLGRLRDPGSPVRKVVLPTRLLVRASCGPEHARPGDPSSGGGERETGG